MSFIQTQILIAIHAALPSARLRRPTQYVYRVFKESAACTALAGDDVSYTHFVSTWNKHCGHVKLKKAMRFTKCDVCVLSTEALDRARMHGGPGWRSEAMKVIEKQLEDHYRVRVIVFGQWIFFGLLSIEKSTCVLVIFSATTEVPPFSIVPNGVS